MTFGQPCESTAPVFSGCSGQVSPRMRAGRRCSLGGCPQWMAMSQEQLAGVRRFAVGLNLAYFCGHLWQTALLHRWHSSTMCCLLCARKWRGWRAHSATPGSEASASMASYKVSTLWLPRPLECRCSRTIACWRAGLRGVHGFAAVAHTFARRPQASTSYLSGAENAAGKAYGVTTRGAARRALGSISNGAGVSWLAAAAVVIPVGQPGEPLSSLDSARFPPLVRAAFCVVELGVGGHDSCGASRWRSSIGCRSS